MENECPYCGGETVACDVFASVLVEEEIAYDDLEVNGCKWCASCLTIVKEGRCL